MEKRVFAAGHGHEFDYLLAPELPYALISPEPSLNDTVGRDPIPPGERGIQDHANSRPTNLPSDGRGAKEFPAFFTTFPLFGEPVVGIIRSKQMYLHTPSL
jgi:hypothetical protein